MANFTSSKVFDSVNVCELFLHYFFERRTLLWILVENPRWFLNQVIFCGFTIRLMPSPFNRYITKTHSDVITKTPFKFRFCKICVLKQKCYTAVLNRNTKTIRSTSVCRFNVNFTLSYKIIVQKISKKVFAYQLLSNEVLYK